MKFNEKTTEVVVIVLFVIAGIYDLAQFIVNGVPGTISAFMAKVGIQNLFTVFVVGLLIGHFWFPVVVTIFKEEK